MPEAEHDRVALRPGSTVFELRPEDCTEMPTLEGTAASKLKMKIKD